MKSSLKRVYLQRSLRRVHKRAPKRLPKVHYPDRIEVGYKRALLDVVAFTKAVIDRRIKPLLPELQKTYPRAATERKDADADFETLAEELSAARIEITQQYTKEELERLARLTGVAVEEWNARQLNGQLKQIVEVDIFGQEPWLARELKAFVVNNVSLIESIPDEYLGQVEKLVSTSVRTGVRWEDIASEIDERYDVSRSRAELIARDQVGKFQGQLTETRQTDLGIDRYRWRDSGDARVRETHRENSIRDEGYGAGVYLWSDPPETGHPGQDYQCRCSAEPVLDDFFDTGA